MAKAKKICLICGKEYTPCSYCEGDTMAFHYRKICCSTECAKIYLARVLESRKNKQDTQVLDITDENISITESDTDIAEGDIQENNIEKPKRKYTKKIKEESENSEKIV